MSDAGLERLIAKLARLKIERDSQKDSSVQEQELKAKQEEISKVGQELSGLMKRGRWQEAEALLKRNESLTSELGKAMVDELTQLLKDWMRPDCFMKPKDGIALVCKLLKSTDVFYEILDGLTREYEQTNGRFDTTVLVEMLKSDPSPDNIRMMDARSRLACMALDKSEMYSYDQLKRVDFNWNFCSFLDSGPVPFLAYEKKPAGSSLEDRFFERYQMKFEAKLQISAASEQTVNDVYIMLKATPKQFPNWLSGTFSYLLRNKQAVGLVLDHFYACKPSEQLKQTVLASVDASQRLMFENRKY
ncbi:MAG: hypothetical protein JSS32_04615 [Verrucomicrobia bacterium]|nr:hypothetical protein [Verrucomicrobiota bacterium]